MSFLFNASDKPTIGVEIELQIIDPETCDLVPKSEDILKLCKLKGMERVKAEIHKSMLEIDSEVSETVKQCRGFLRERIIGLNEVVESLGLELAVTGTHPSQHWPERLISNTERYHYLHEKFQWLTRRMNVYGMHVHIGVQSGDRALAICQGMIQYLPHLLALSANSPFWQGIDTGMKSSRISIMDAFPFSGLPKAFTEWKQFAHYCSTLSRAGSISSFKDLYWYVRPNLTYGTVEIRICDAMTTLDEAIALVAFIQCLVAKISRESEISLPEEYYWIAPDNLWTAARDGLDGMIICNLQGKRKKIADDILDLLKVLSPIAQSLDCEEELFHINSIIENGNGAQRQLTSYSKNRSLSDVVAIAQNEFKASFKESPSLKIFSML